MVLLLVKAPLPHDRIAKRGVYAMAILSVCLPLRLSHLLTINLSKCRTRIASVGDPIN